MNERPVALITGASRGIGAATALEFSRRGYDLALLAEDAAGLQSVADQVRASGSAALVLPVDLSDLAATQTAMAELQERFGRLDVLVNNAAWRKVQSMRETDLASWDRTLRICLTAPAFLAQWAAALMQPQGRGVIINISSIRAQTPDGTCAAYVAAKGGLESLSYELAALYGPVGIRVLALGLGAIDTSLSNDLAPAGALGQVLEDCLDRTPLGRFGQPDEIARLIATLASDDASFITGTTILADGGLSRNGYGRRIKHLMQPEQF